MEAQRPPTDGLRYEQLSESSHDLIESLPAPPAPFPDYRIGENGHATSSNVMPPTIDNQDLSIIQSTCINALASLLSQNPSTTSAPLTENDRPLAAALMELLETTYELESFGPSPAYEEVAGPSESQRSVSENQPSTRGPEASFAALEQYLGNLQSGLPGGSMRRRESIQPAVNVYRQEVAMERVQILSRVILGLIRARENDPADIAAREAIEPSIEIGNMANTQQDRTSTPTVDSPVYEKESPLETLPGYAETTDLHDNKDRKEVEAGPSSPVRYAPTSEKMLHDLDNLTNAIERLGSMAPQYADQRSVLRPPRPRSEISLISAENNVGKGKGKEDRRTADKAKMKELEGIWRQIERAHGKRRMRDNQRVDMNGVQGRRAEERGQFLQELYDRAELSRMRGQDGNMGIVDGDLARARELRDRDKFLRDLLEVSAGARMGDQDAAIPDEEYVAAQRAERHDAFIQDLMDRVQVGRLDSQDYPVSPQTSVQEHRQQLIDSLMRFSSSGRMADQDSAPPTPRQRSGTGVQDPHELVTMEKFFEDAPETSEEMSVKRPSRRPVSAGADYEKKMGTFGKIKGMMRRGSLGLGLGLKATKEVDLQQLNYVAEHQENLNIVTVTLFGPLLPLFSDLQLKSFDPGSCSLPAVEAILVKDDLSLQIPMPVPIHPHQAVPLVPLGSLLEAKLASVPLSSFAPTLISSISHPLSATELRQLDPRGFCCTVCDREIASIPSFSRGRPVEVDERFKDLPSEHWAEMMEVWMCHDDPGFTARLASQTKEGFWPMKGRILVGGSYVLVNSADVKNGNVLKLSQDLNWEIVSCFCGEVLGKARTQDGKPGAGTLRLSKWAIALLRDDDVDGEKVEPTRYPLGVYVTSDMLDLAQAHATYRFMIVDEETEEQKVLVWLFNPSIRISYRRAPSAITAGPPSPLRTTFTSTKLSTKSRRSSLTSSASISQIDSESDVGQTRNLRVCKIMYRQMSPGSPSLGQTGQGQVEELRYPTQIVDRLLRALEASTLVYPEERRRMGNWDVGFLGRM